MEQDKLLRDQLIRLLNWGDAHVKFDAAVRDLSEPLQGRRPETLPYSPWQLLEHLRIAQHDILEFCRDADYESLPWPEGYWPTNPAPPSARAWEETAKQFREDLRQMQALLADPATDLFAPIAHGDGQTVLREALLLADHNAYHLGQLIVVRRLLGAWPDGASA